MINKKYLIIGLVFLVVLIIIINENQAIEEIGLEISEVCFEENCYRVEIADSMEERAKGLMNRKGLCQNCGMLFIYEKLGDYKFWMKNTLIPLDIIWLDSNLEVIHIANAVPCITEDCRLYGPDLDSVYILEINSGRSEEIGLDVGDSLDFVYS